MSTKRTLNTEELIRGVSQGNRKDISKAITVLEDGLAGSGPLYSEIYRRGGRAFVLGVAGPSGAGKSSLIDCLIKEFRSRGLKVGVVAVDPTSPFTGGALLGDRIRMVNHSLDEGVYIRSMASRGSKGGLSRSAKKAIDVLDAANFDVVMLESVGIGQTEVDIIKVAHVTLVVVMPEMGDSVQAMKAGLMEIGDVFVVNKADLGGADRALLEISQFAKARDGSRPVVLKTVARTCEGVPELVNLLTGMMTKAGARDDRKRDGANALEEVKDALESKMERRLLEGTKSKSGWAELIEQVALRKMDPDAAADRIMNEIGAAGESRAPGGTGKTTRRRR